MKKSTIFLTAILIATITTFTSCKLPWASIQGATVVDYIPVLLLVLGIPALLYVGYDQLKNGAAYSGQKKNPAQIRALGVAAIIAILFAIFWIIGA